MRERLTPLYYLIPLFLLELTIVIYPIFLVVRSSFTHLFYLEPETLGKFAGLYNYERLLSDPLFWWSARNSVTWTVLGASIRFILGLFMAILLNQELLRRFRLVTLSRTLVLLPWVSPGVVGMICWKLIYMPTHKGLLNAVLMRVGLIDAPIAWLVNDLTIWPAAVIASTWKGLPFVTLAFLAGLQAIPRELYDSANVDGAGFLQTVRHVTVPLLMPVAIPILLINCLWMFNNFLQLYILTGGGPSNATMVLPLLLFYNAFDYREMGIASSIGVLILVVLMGFVYGQQKLRREEVGR